MSINVLPATIETIHFLRTLTDDGSLSGEEVWALANWLNHHPFARKVWPGDLLVPPLQSAFADGELTFEEMSQLASLLSEIERNWASREAAAEAPKRKARKSQRQQPLESLALTFDRSGAPELPSLPIRTRVRSHSSDEVYEVDLANHTCECGDWVSKRSRTAWPAATNI